MTDDTTETATNTDSTTSRREILQKAAGITTAIAVPAAANAYSVPDLQYPFEALEPYIDAPTMKIHHDKHHGKIIQYCRFQGTNFISSALTKFLFLIWILNTATYVANINKATEGKPEVDILELQLNALEAGPAVRNNGGGHYNHAVSTNAVLYLSSV